MLWFAQSLSWLLFENSIGLYFSSWLIQRRLDRQPEISQRIGVKQLPILSACFSALSDTAGTSMCVVIYTHLHLNRFLKSIQFNLIESNCLSGSEAALTAAAQTHNVPVLLWSGDHDFPHKQDQAMAARRGWEFLEVPGSHMLARWKVRL